LAENLLDASTFDQGAARTISMHGTQNLAATAFGALVNGRAVGEGFAMAFKALCDELGFECIVVLGYYQGMLHAWNIVALYGDYYHIDLAMSDISGIETSFLRTDADFLEMGYEWDMENTVSCEGALTFEDIRPELPEDPDSNEAGDDQEAGGDQGNEDDSNTGLPEDTDGEPDQTGESTGESTG
jgi:hypothetical protein